MSVPAALTPLVLASITTAITSVFPAFVSWRFFRNEQDMPSTKQERTIQYAIIACLTFLHLAEAAKAAYFGLIYSNANYLLSIVPRLALQYVISFLAEAAHILLVCVVMMRMSGLVEIRRKGFASLDHPSYDVYTLIGYAIIISRLFLPFICLVMQRQLNAFGSYTLLVLSFEIGVFIYASVITSRFLTQLRREDDLQIPAWRLFSNSIVTICLSSISFITLVGMAATYNSSYETFYSNITYIGPLVMPSLYSVLVCVTLIMYQDTKLLILEAKSGSITTSPKKKFVPELFQ